MFLPHFEWFLQRLDSRSSRRLIWDIDIASLERPLHSASLRADATSKEWIQVSLDRARAVPIVSLLETSEVETMVVGIPF